MNMAFSTCATAVKNKRKSSIDGNHNRQYMLSSAPSNSVQALTIYGLKLLGINDPQRINIFSGYPSSMTL